MAAENSNSGVKIPTFSGTVGESAKFWLAKFEQVMKLKKVKNEDKCVQLFLLLEGQAELWYHTLSDEIQGDYKSFTKAFTDRFLPSEVDRVVNVRRFRGLMQLAGESTDDYIEKVIRAGNDIKKSEQEMMDQIYQGLDPSIMKFVAKKEAKTLNEVRKYARMGQSFVKEVNSSVMEVKVQGKDKQTGKCDFQSFEKSRYQVKRCFICHRKSHLARDCWFRLMN